MGADAKSRTSPTLLGRLRQQPADQQAWDEFVRRYGPRVYHWCRRWHVQDADAQDATQEVLCILAVKLITFAYDPRRSFRAWLRTVANHAVADVLTKQRLAAAETQSSAALQALDSAEARVDLMSRLETEFDLEILNEAKARVQLTVTPRTWEAFQLTAVDGQSGFEVAERLDMSVPAVYEARRRVQKLLREQVVRLGGAEL